MNTEDIINGLKHMADDHECCREVLEEAIKLIEHMAGIKSDDTEAIPPNPESGPIAF